MNKIVCKIKNKKERYSIQLYLIVFALTYALFALDRIKNILSLKVGGRNTTNEIWIILLIYLISRIFSTKKPKLSINKYNFYLITCIYLFIIVVIIGAYNVDSVQQYIYAILLFLTPILLFFITSKLNTVDINFLIKTIVLLSLGYAIFAIILTTNYAFFMKLVGNPIDNYRYYSQYRASMMLGSSITVSYYFNLTLPLCFYLFYDSKEKRWRIISILSIIMNIIGTAVLLSRAATICMIIIVLYNVFSVNTNIRKIGSKILLLFLLLASAIYALKKYDLSRLMIGFQASGSSIAARLTAGNLGLYIFSKHWIFGSGMGRFFRRVYDYRFITVNEITGLIDPHNMYVLVLSETGLVGFIIVVMMFIILFRSFSNIDNKLLKNIAFITLFAFLFDAMGGSHLINEISYAIIFWIYMGLFNAMIKKDRDRNQNIEGVKRNESNVYRLS